MKGLMPCARSARPSSRRVVEVRAEWSVSCRKQEVDLGEATRPRGQDPSTAGSVEQWTLQKFLAVYHGALSAS